MRIEVVRTHWTRNLTEEELSRTIPIATHADEGTGAKKDAVWCCSFNGIFATGDVRLRKIVYMLMPRKNMAMDKKKNATLDET